MYSYAILTKVVLCYLELFNLANSAPWRSWNQRNRKMTNLWRTQHSSHQMQQLWWTRWKIQRNQWNPDVEYRLQNNIPPPGHRRKPGFYPEISPEELGEKFEGDMAVHPPIRRKRGVLSDRFQRWPIGLIHYKLDDRYSAKQKALILEAMNEITAKTVVKGSRCIYFAPRTIQNDFLVIKPDVGCYSSVGRIGGAQTVSLEPDCIYKGTIMHELLHAIGLWHEQSRMDRDDYVTVNYENILEDPVVNRSVNFLKYSVDYLDDLNLPYDYNSIMHYGFAFFAKDPYSPTLSPKYPYAFIGQRRFLSPLDIKKVQLLYGCGSSTKWDCDFEAGNLCNWIQDKDVLFNWQLQKGPTRTAFTGPSGDNTNGLGYYIYAEADGHSHQECRLWSPVLPHNFYCIQLHYHMAGYTVGLLELRAQSTRTHDEDVLMSKKGHQGDKWLHEQIEYPARTSFKLVLTAKIGADSYGDIAVDDISIEPGFCENNQNFKGINIP